MNKQIEKINRKKRKKNKIRARISGSAAIPRLNVFKSSRGEYAQLIDDVKGVTIIGMLSKSIDKNGTKSELSRELGKEIGRIAKEKGINKAVFDRAGNKYHGRVKALAEGARESGLEF